MGNVTHAKQGRRKFCERCHEADISSRDAFTRFCMPCQRSRLQDNGGSAAHHAVHAAIRRGELPHPKTLLCTDCGKPAMDYDHRDYGKPLQVEAVCRSCNRLRGPARPVLTFELPDEQAA